MITTQTPPLASFGFFNSRAAIDFDQIHAESMDEAIEKMRKSVDEVNRALENAPSSGESFGEKIKQAVKRKSGRAVATERRAKALRPEDQASCAAEISPSHDSQRA
jgi:hypothetical protein